MLKNKLLILSLIAFILILPALSIGEPDTHFAFSPAISGVQNPQTFGKIADNGVVLAFWYVGFLNAQNVIDSSTLIHTNQVFLTIINTHNSSLNFVMSGHIYSQNNLTKNIDNLSVSESVSPLSEQSFQINLPLFTGNFIVKYSYRNVNFSFSYIPVKALFPTNINTVGQKIVFALEIIFEVSMATMTASVMASGMLKKMYYFPKKSASTMILVISGFAIALFVILNSVYLYILSIPYYFYLIPVFFSILFLELELRHSGLKESVFVSISKSEHSAEGIPVFDDSFFIVKYKNKHIVVDSESIYKAFKRLFGLYTYMDFPAEYVHFLNIDGNREYYFLQPDKDFRNAIVSQYKEHGNGKISKHIKFKHYRVNLSSNAHVGDIIRVLAGVSQTVDLAKQKNDYLNENMNLKAQIRNGSVQANFKFLYKFSKLISGIKDIIPESELQLIESEISKTKEELDKESTMLKESLKVKTEGMNE